MSTRNAPSVRRPWTRAGEPERRPNRSWGGLYRTAEREEPGETLGGVPLHSAEDAVVAAVRMGYRIADEQIERGRRVADRLRAAAAREGTEPADAVDGLEHLFTQLLVSALRWFEETTRDPQSPLRRFASAELGLLASLLGLSVGPAGARDGRGAARRARRSDSERPRGPAVGEPSEPRYASVRSYSEPVTIQHDLDAEPRPVHILTWRVAEGDEASTKLTFYHAGGKGTMSATLEHGKRGPVLRMHIGSEHEAGRWRAAVLTPDRTQVGVIEIEL
jgi:hypothetical protein